MLLEVARLRLDDLDLTRHTQRTRGGEDHQHAVYPDALPLVVYPPGMDLPNAGRAATCRPPARETLRRLGSTD
ncbi:hypothetical protein ACFWIQ_19455 [Kitasatospora sp. NPDC127059]|uniref:hypothetical protein n=1 Tax=unclassified Kitasatospora TaxID=2633591 RepID=UPI0036477995